MSRHLDRLFTQALAEESAKSALPPRRRDAAADDGEGEGGAGGAADAPPADLSAPARILAAFKARDYAACLGLPSVSLDELGRPVFDVTDRRAAAPAALAAWAARSADGSARKRSRPPHTLQGCRRAWRCL